MTVVRSASPSVGSASLLGVGTADEGGDITSDGPTEDEAIGEATTGAEEALAALPFDLLVRLRSGFSTTGSESTEPDDHTFATAGGAGMPKDGIPLLNVMEMTFEGLMEMTFEGISSDHDHTGFGEWLAK